MRILVAEDHPSLARSIADGLRDEGYAVDLTFDGNEALHLASSNPYDMIILDIMLPGRDGFSIIQVLRRRDVQIPILCLTARDGIVDRVKGLDLGADDYLVKPFAWEELLARVRSMVRRGHGKKSATIAVGDLEIDTARKSARRGSTAIDLSAREFALLEYLAHRQGQVVTRSDIWEHLYDQHDETTSNVVDVYIGYLRNKIDKEFPTKLIHTRRGQGYLLGVEGWRDAAQHMTRRIALAILLTVWAILIAGCATAYLTMRSVLIDQLDESLKAKAQSLPELGRFASVGGAADAKDAERNPGTAVRNAPIPADATNPRHGDRYVIKNAAGQTLSPAAGGLAASDISIVTASFATLNDGTRVRSLTLRATVPGPGSAPVPLTISYQSSAVTLDRLLDRVAFSFILFGIAAGLIAALVAMRVSRAALKPLHATADVIGTIDPANLHRRIEAAQLPPELLPMASRLNEMLARIEYAYAQRHQFLADASHELRTPVAALVTTAEVSLRHPRDAQSYRATIESCLDDARLLRRLVERLMEQCRADTLSHDEAPEEIDITPLLDQCADQAAAIAGERSVTVLRQIPASLHITTQPQRLRSIVVNLLANAVEYNRPGGEVELTVALDAQALGMTVRDTGSGIAAEHIPHLFEPFYRADKARSGEAGHLGLGLSLVQSHVQALGGHIRIQSTPGVGTTFSVELPLAKTPNKQLAGALL